MAMPLLLAKIIARPQPACHSNLVEKLHFDTRELDQIVIF